MDLVTGDFYVTGLLDFTLVCGEIRNLKARQAQGANVSVQTEPEQPALKFESKYGAQARQDSGNL